MSALLVVYGTTEGHTRKVAERAAAVAREWGHTTYVVESGRAPSPAGAVRYGGVMAFGSLHAGRHQRTLVRWAREQRQALDHLPTAFFSVSLAATGQDLPGAQACVDRFVADTGWHPGMVRLVAGALMYSRYGLLKRWMMRRIAARAGGDTDTSHDYVYTDWERLRSDVETFLLTAIPVPQRPAEQPVTAAAF
jgi:menaquinone-dependent protoporphyrinogen oxidase